ncbi:hypothetical protein GYH30_023310 [Glycine max]|nr:hypothetical protein GYH30_023310 [Glycine max]
MDPVPLLSMAASMVLHPPLFHSKLRHVCFLVFIFPAQYFLFEERKQVLIPIFLLHFLHFTEPLSILVGGEHKIVVCFIIEAECECILEDDDA